jgi:anaerobic ribonucleoside-triphosphate reductase
MIDKEATDITLFVRTSNEEVVEWDRRRIVNALVLEAGVDLKTAEEISKEVEKQIFSSGIGILTAPLIRELVNAKLIERGYEEARRMHTRLGFPLYDIGQLILTRNRENANVPHWPEGTNLTLAEGIKKEFALHRVFSRDVADAHLSGDIHLHKLGYIDRPYSSIQSLEYVKKFGLSLPGSPSVARPAKHADVLLAHMIRFSAALQGNFAGSLEWDAVNLSFAPYLSRMNEGEVSQLAQRLVYEFSQLAFARGGQVMFTDIHLFWEVPDRFEEAPVTGPGGVPFEGNHEDFLGDSQRFLLALLDVFKEGDATGRPFFFPRPVIHISEKSFKIPGWRKFLEEACDVAAKRGNIHFAFDRAGKKKGEESLPPWKMRRAAVQNVTLNLPRIGYRAEEDDAKLFSLLSERMALAAKAHVQKRDFIEKLISYGDDGPLSFLTMKRDAYPYLRMDQAVYLIGVLGLNELVQIHGGRQFHESEEAVLLGMKILTHMKKEAENLGRKHGICFILEQTPAESTAYRFARLDLRLFSPRSGRFVRGDISRGEVYYNNSTSFNVSADMPAMERARGEGRFHPFIEGTAVTHIWPGDKIPSKETLARFIEIIFKETNNKRVTLSPEFTSCVSCGRTSLGLKDRCRLCVSENVEKITKITGYFARVSDLNKGKLAELRDIRRNPP